MSCRIKDVDMRKYREHRRAARHCAAALDCMFGADRIRFGRHTERRTLASFRDLCPDALTAVDSSFLWSLAAGSWRLADSCRRPLPRRWRGKQGGHAGVQGLRARAKAKSLAGNRAQRRLYARQRFVSFDVKLSLFRERILTCGDLL